MKDELRKRLGRSPGKGDAVVMCLSEGNAAQRKLLRVGSGGAEHRQHGLQQIEEAAVAKLCRPKPHAEMKAVIGVH